jgi:hypothetical protein
VYAKFREQFPAKSKPGRRIVIARQYEYLDVRPAGLEFPQKAAEKIYRTGRGNRAVIDIARNDQGAVRRAGKRFDKLVQHEKLVFKERVFVKNFPQMEIGGMEETEGHVIQHREAAAGCQCRALQ